MDLQRIAWLANKNIFRHLDRRQIILDPDWCEAERLHFTEVECNLVECAWIEDGKLNLHLGSVILVIPLHAVRHSKVVPKIVKDRPRLWW